MGYVHGPGSRESLGGGVGTSGRPWIGHTRLGFATETDRGGSSWANPSLRVQVHKWLFPKIRGPILVVPIIRTIAYLSLFWGPLFMEAPK